LIRFIPYKLYLKIKNPSLLVERGWGRVKNCSIIPPPNTLFLSYQTAVCPEVIMN
jgi:hypothetical protein